MANIRLIVLGLGLGYTSYGHLADNILRAIPSIYERDALGEVLQQQVGKFLYQTSITLSLLDMLLHGTETVTLVVQIDPLLLNKHLEL